MPYKDPAKQRQASTEWVRQRRADWLARQSCHGCGAREGLHIIGADKGAFSARPERREVLLATAQVLCDGCWRQGRARLAAAAHQRRKLRRRVPEDQKRKGGRRPLYGPPAPRVARAPRPRRASRPKAERAKRSPAPPRVARPAAPRTPRKGHRICSECNGEVDVDVVFHICLRKRPADG